MLNGQSYACCYITAPLGKLPPIFLLPLQTTTQNPSFQCDMRQGFRRGEGGGRKKEGTPPPRHPKAVVGSIYDTVSPHQLKNPQISRLTPPPPAPPPPPGALFLFFFLSRWLGRWVVFCAVILRILYYVVRNGRNHQFSFMKAFCLKKKIQINLSLSFPFLFFCWERRVRKEKKRGYKTTVGKINYCFLLVDLLFSLLSSFPAPFFLPAELKSFFFLPF